MRTTTETLKEEIESHCYTAQHVAKCPMNRKISSGDGVRCGLKVAPKKTESQQQETLSLRLRWLGSPKDDDEDEKLISREW